MAAIHVLLLLYYSAGVLVTSMYKGKVMTYHRYLRMVYRSCSADRGFDDLGKRRYIRWTGSRLWG